MKPLFLSLQQGSYPLERGWNVMGGPQNNPAAGYRGAWPNQAQDLNQLFQSRQQQMNNGGMGHMHLSQVSASTLIPCSQFKIETSTSD